MKSLTQKNIILSIKLLKKKKKIKAKARADISWFLYKYHTAAKIKGIITISKLKWKKVIQKEIHLFKIGVIK